MGPDEQDPPILVRPDVARPPLPAVTPVKEKPPLNIVPDVGKIEKLHKPKKNDLEREGRWHPSGEDIDRVRQLAELGWPVKQIADAFGLSGSQFGGAMVRLVELRDAYEKGLEDSKTYAERQLLWRPSPEDIVKTREYAAKGLTKPAIAGKLGVTPQIFGRRVADTPQLSDAFELGSAEYQAALLEDSQRMLDERDPALRNVTGMSIFKQKALCGLTDRPNPTVQVSGEVQHKHEHKLKTPEPVKIEDVAEFAKREMERAAKIGAEQLKQLPAVIDAEVQDVTEDE